MNQEIRIVIAQRGWVFVGRFTQDGERCWVRNGYAVRRWGTSRGLGQLATEGPQPSTVLDPAPDVQLHELGIVATITCDPAKWANRCVPR